MSNGFKDGFLNRELNEKRCIKKIFEFALKDLLIGVKCWKIW